MRQWADLGRPLKIGLVGCAKAKRSAPSPARALYASDLFRAALEYAELTCDETYILSAFHGLVAPDQVLAPYDFAIGEMRKRERLAWGERVASQLRARLPGLRVELTVLAGRPYAVPVIVSASVRGWKVETPLSGLYVGERRAWLRRQVRALSTPKTVRRRPRRSQP